MLTHKNNTKEELSREVPPLTVGVAVVVGPAFLKTYYVPGTRQDDLHIIPTSHNYLTVGVVLYA